MKAKICYAGAVLFLTSSVALAATIPSVGCPSDGQMGPAKAPQLAPHSANLVPDVARQLAYYQGDDTPGTLAPRGWNCFVLRGSSGNVTIVAPQPLSFASLTYTEKRIAGPVIELGYTIGGTSGRFEVAQLIARLFPAHRDFVRGVINEGIESSKDFPSGPFPRDHLRYITAAKVEFTTLANNEGLGTWGRLAKDNVPIRGVVTLLNNGDMDIIRTAVRLRAGQDRLTDAIISQSE